MRSLTVAFALLIAAAASFGGDLVDAGKLYPKCGGRNHSLAVGYKHGSVGNPVTKLPYTAAALEIDCLAFEVVPVTSGPLIPRTADAKAKCTREYFESENPFRLYLEAEKIGEDGKGSGEKTVWDLDDTLGGSVDKLHYWNDGMSYWSIWFVNKDSARCPMQLNMLVKVKPLTDRVHAHPSPGLILVDPTTIYVNRNSLIAFKVIGGPMDDDKVRVRPAYVGDDASSDADYIQLDRVTDKTTLSRHKLYDDSTTSAWSHNFKHGGNYLLEYKRALKNGSGYVATAHLIVYGGNPAYFRITKGSGPDGQLYLHHKTVFTFYGSHLNTNKGGDEVKFVNFTKQCSDGAQSFDNAGSRDLGPGDEDDTTQADWTFTLKHGGSIRVCYKTATSNDWNEVVSYDDLDHLGPATNAPAGSIPVPTHPISGRKCKLAPLNPSKEQEGKTDIKLTLKGETFSHKLITKLALVLCIEEKTIQILRVGTSHVGASYVAIDIVCHQYGMHAQCLGSDRKDMLKFMWSNPNLKKELTDLGISNVQGEKRGAEINTVYAPSSAGPTKVSGHKHSIAFFFFIFVILAAMAGAVYYFRDEIRTKMDGQRRSAHNFMQVGTVGDDDEDENHNTPHDTEGGGGGGQTVGQRAARSVPESSRP